MSARKMRVFVTDGDTRAALAVTRSLGRLGHDVLVGEKRKPALAHISRFCAERILYPDPVVASDAFVASAEKLVRECGVDLIVPVAEVTTALITSERERFEPSCAVPFAPAEVFRRASNKVDVVETAMRIGVPVPKHVVLHGPGDLSIAEAEALGFPLVIKPAQSRVRTPDGWMFTSVGYAANADELRRSLRARPAHDYPLMLQERIVGTGTGVFAHYHAGHPVALFSHRRLRERPPSGGVSVLCESVPLSPVTAGYATRLLGELRWHGAAMVEFKNDDRDGVPKLMEINGRLWGSLQLAIDAGVDFPALIAQSVEGPPVPQPPYRVGVRNRWFWGDVDALLLRIGRGVTAPHLEGQGRVRACLDFLRMVGPGLYYDNPKPDDIRPWVFESYEWIRKGFGLGPSGIRADAQAATLAAWGPTIVPHTPASSASAGPRSFDIRVARSLDAAGLDERAWNALGSRGATNSVFQTHQWARAWDHAFGRDHRPLLLTASDSGGLAALAPLTVQRRGPERVVKFLGHGLSDYCDLLAPAGDRWALTAVIEALLRSAEWDRIILNNIPAHSPTIHNVRSLCERARLPFAIDLQFVCPTLLVEGQEARAAEILRKPSLRRPVNDFSRAGRLTYRDLTSAEEVEPWLDRFFAQHVARWKGSGTPSLFVDGRNREFYRELTRALGPTGWVLFTSVERDGEPIAFHYGFDYDNVLMWHKPSFAIEHAAKSPGLVLVHHLIRRAIQTKRRELDFAVGGEPFKRRFTTGVRSAVQIRIYRDRARYLLHQSRRSMVSAVKNLVSPAGAPE